MTRGRTHTVAPVLALLALSGCAQAAGQQDTLEGPAPKAFLQDQPSPYERYLSCVKRELPRTKSITVGIGRVKDATGKYNLDRGTGRFVTQGATDQLYTMFHIEGRESLVERAQTKILQWERQQGELPKDASDERTVLGKVNGQNGEVLTKDRLIERLSPSLQEKIREGKVDLNSIDMKNQNGDPLVVRDGEVFVKRTVSVPANALRSSDYYIVGSINRLDTTTSSGDIAFRVAGLGPEARGFAMQVGLDLRAVDTGTSVVSETISVDKQVVGHSYGFGVGKVFGTTLVELDAQAKKVEPLQTEALKGMLQYASGQLLARLYDVDVPKRCQEHLEELDGYELVPTEDQRKTAALDRRDEARR